MLTFVKPVASVLAKLFNTLGYGLQIDDINAAFVLAREEIEYAQEDAESTYFNESYQTAKSAVDKVLGDFNSVLQRLDPPEREKLQRSMGLKMEQLKVCFKETHAEYNPHLRNLGSASGISARWCVHARRGRTSHGCPASCPDHFGDAP